MNTNEHYAPIGNAPTASSNIGGNPTPNKVCLDYSAYNRPQESLVDCGRIPKECVVAAIYNDFIAKDGDNLSIDEAKKLVEENTKDDKDSLKCAQTTITEIHGCKTNIRFSANSLDISELNIDIESLRECLTRLRRKHCPGFAYVQDCVIEQPK